MRVGLEVDKEEGRPSNLLQIPPGRHRRAICGSTYKMNSSAAGRDLRPAAARAGGHSPGGFLETVTSASAGGSYRLLGAGTVAGRRPGLALVR